MVGTRTYEEVSSCLTMGGFPTSAEAGRLFQKSLTDSLQELFKLVHDVIDKIPYVHQSIRGQVLPERDPEGSFVYNLLWMMTFIDKKTLKPNLKDFRWLEKILTINADHETSCATFAYLMAASASSDPLSCYLAAVSILYGIICCTRRCCGRCLHDDPASGHPRQQTKLDSRCWRPKRAAVRLWAPDLHPRGSPSRVTFIRSTIPIAKENLQRPLFPRQGQKDQRGFLFESRMQGNVSECAMHSLRNLESGGANAGDFHKTWSFS